MTYARAAAAILTAVLPALAATAAIAKPVVVVTLAQATVVTAADGAEHVAALTDNVPVTRGTAIRYTVSAKDTGTDPARRLALTGRVPSGTAYTPGSLRGPGGHAEYSLDGKTFSAHPMVAVKTSAGSVLQPADPAQYVVVRWVKDAPLDANTSTGFSYEVRVK
jgi:uncharacterized repeat protein (TIGR01451 family)